MDAVARFVVDGVTLEYEESGVGEPVVFIHGVLIADSFRPLRLDFGQVDRYRLITYHRRGYVGSSRPREPVSLAEQAADCAPACCLSWAYAAPTSSDTPLAAPSASNWRSMHRSSSIR
jgi:pimeloyl-ACP methyl ester carboxylesterase